MKQGRSVLVALEEGIKKEMETEAIIHSRVNHPTKRNQLYCPYKAPEDERVFTAGIRSSSLVASILAGIPIA